MSTISFFQEEDFNQNSSKNSLKPPRVYSWIIKDQHSKKENINEIITNTEKNPYLFNLFNEAKKNPEIKFYVFYYFDVVPAKIRFSQYTMNKILEDNKNSKYTQSIKNNTERQNAKIHNFKKEIDERYKKEDGRPQFENIKFVNLHETIQNIEKIYQKLNQDADENDAKKFSNSLIEDIYNKYGDFSYDKAKNNFMAKKIDYLKILGAFYTAEKEDSAVLITDFDTEFEKLNENFDKKSNLPKFIRWYNLILDGENENIDPKKDPRFNQKSITEALILFPKNDAFYKMFLSCISYYEFLGGEIFLYLQYFLLCKDLDNIEKIHQYLKEIDFKDLSENYLKFDNLYPIVDLIFLNKIESEYFKDKPELKNELDQISLYTFDQIENLKESIIFEKSYVKIEEFEKESRNKEIEEKENDQITNEPQNEKYSDKFPVLKKIFMGELKIDIDKFIDMKNRYEELYFQGKNSKQEFRQLHGESWTFSKENEEVNDIEFNDIFEQIDEFLKKDKKNDQEQGIFSNSKNKDTVVKNYTFYTLGSIKKININRCSTENLD